MVEFFVFLLFVVVVFRTFSYVSTPENIPRDHNVFMFRQANVPAWEVKRKRMKHIVTHSTESIHTINYYLMKQFRKDDFFIVVSFVMDVFRHFLMAVVGLSKYANETV